MTADKALQMEAAELCAMIATLRHGLTIKDERQSSELGLSCGMLVELTARFQDAE